MAYDAVVRMLTENIVDTIAKGEVIQRKVRRLQIFYKSSASKNGHEVILVRNQKIMHGY